MITTVLWILIAIQIALGAFDTLYHHELTERLAWRPSARRELALHALRNSLYVALFLAFGWTRPEGLWAVLVLVILAAELGLTLWDFVEEDRTRRLPASERVTHTLLALNYGAILAWATPVLLAWSHRSSALPLVNLGPWSALATLAALGVGLFALRDLAAWRRLGRHQETPAAQLVAALPAGQKLLVCGGTGFIGRRLITALVTAGHQVTLLTRGVPDGLRLPTPIRIVTSLDPITEDERFDGIVNLAGEPIASGLWTRRKRAEILRSRVRTTRALVALIGRLEQPPPVLISASAIGWYGLRDDEPLDETAGATPCFTQRVCAARERAAVKAEAFAVRVGRLRIGLVLASEGGLLGQLLPAFSFGLGGPIGSGQQWLSWIDRDDLVRLIAHALATPSLSGPLNGTAPAPRRNKDLAAALGRALGRPAVLPLPAWPLERLLGDFARELLLSGQRVLPRKALASGFRFAYPELEGALAHCLGGPTPKADSRAHVPIVPDPAPSRAGGRRPSPG